MEEILVSQLDTMHRLELYTASIMINLFILTTIGLWMAIRWARTGPSHRAHAVSDR